MDNPNASHWNRDDGYQSNANENDVYPRRVFNYFTSQFEAFFVLRMLLDSHCEISPGLKIAFHMPDELPPFYNSIHILPNQKV